MDDTQAHKIISALADGCESTTGEKLEGSVLQHGDVIRALHIAIRALETSARSKVRSNRARTPANAGKPWTEPEDRELLEKFDAGQTVAQLAQAHDRTPAGIHARLERHGRLQGPGPQLRGRAATAAVGAIRSRALRNMSHPRRCRRVHPISRRQARPMEVLTKFTPPEPRVIFWFTQTAAKQPPPPLGSGVSPILR